MPYHLLSVGGVAWSGTVDDRLSLGTLELGPDISRETPIAGLLEHSGGEVIGVWQSAARADPDYLIVTGEVEPERVETALADTEFVLADFRRIVAPGLAGLGSDASIRDQLAIMSLGPEEEECPTCGMFGGLHVEPPPLPH